MALVKYDPFSGYSSLAKRMDNLLNSFDDSFTPAVRGFAPSIDISEDENNVYLQAELPGIKREDIKVTVNDNNVLLIKGKKERRDEDKSEENGRTYWRSERSYGEFMRSFQLPDNVKSDEVDAKFEDGVLNIKLVKIEPEKPKERLVDNF